MAVVRNDQSRQPTPGVGGGKADLHVPNSVPKVSALVTAIRGSGFSGRYTDAELQRASRNDLISICRTHGITVSDTI